MSRRPDDHTFRQFLLDHGVVGFFEKPVTLKSGRTSHWYVNWRKVAGDVFLLDQLADFVIAFVGDQQLVPDCFYGVPEGATKLGLVVNYKWARNQKGFGEGSHAFPMGRARPKEHGDPTDRYFVGAPRGNVVVIEDVTTTGGSLLAELDKLAEAKVKVVAAIGLTNRMERRDDGQSVEEALAARGVKYVAMSEATDFLPAACARFKSGEAIGKAIEAEFREYGVKPLRLI
ncbi:MAG: hypothetical protein HY465_05990 [Deltaproteobacteria bacterium]|nr:hypothetical protein [Deltaproteobacteria bacterium]